MRYNVDMLETATFGAGCFWGVEEHFSNVTGVLDTEVGYAGGEKSDATYEEVCLGETGHAEVVRLEFDPEVISYPDLLKEFWKIHDPTQLNRQGPDTGTQYRSVIFFHTSEQEEIAKKSRDEVSASGKYTDDVVTAIEPIRNFVRAEEYHQQYNKKNGRHCAI